MSVVLRKETESVGEETGAGLGRRLQGLGEGQPWGWGGDMIAGGCTLGGRILVARNLLGLDCGRGKGRRRAEKGRHVSRSNHGGWVRRQGEDAKARCWFGFRGEGRKRGEES